MKTVAVLFCLNVNLIIKLQEMTVNLIRNYGLKEIVCAQFAHFYE